jgi:thiol-disulfide isomerase/thioredoxin
MRLRELKLVVMIIFALSHFSCKSQVASKDYPVIGEPIPEFTLTDVHYYSKKNFNSKEVKGRWLILDFWNTACVVCVRSFPRVNQLHIEFKDDIQFLLIAQNNKKYYANIKEVYERYKKRLELTLPIAYDSVLVEKFRVETMPHVVIVDPQGKVYAITVSSALTTVSLQALIQNKKPAFIEKNDAFGAKPQTQWKYLVNSTEVRQRDFLYRSILSRNSGEDSQWAETIDQNAEHGFYQASGIDLASLYKMAWFGQAQWVSWDKLYFTHWMFPVLEVKDSISFEFNYSSVDNRGLYNYSLIIPKEIATKENLMEAMQQDLRKYFGFEASVDSRMMPYWKLTATAEAREKLKTRGEIGKTKFGPTGIDGKRLSIRDFIIPEIVKYSGEPIPIIDETGTTHLIDINFSAVMTNIDDVRKALQKHGLILEKSKKEFKVLVIRDLELLKQ